MPEYDDPVEAPPYPGAPIPHGLSAGSRRVGSIEVRSKIDGEEGEVGTPKPTGKARSPVEGATEGQEFEQQEVENCAQGK
jgi:hypothetical protein